MKRISTILYVVIASLTALIYSGCSKENEEPPVAQPKDSSLLLYAVASNNLDDALHSDLAEIIAVAPELDLESNDLYVYYLTNEDLPALYRLTADKTHGDTQTVYRFETVRNYDRSKFSTDPARISEVLDDYLELTDAGTQGLIFWSHGTGWLPDFSTHSPSASPEESGDRRRSFGYDDYNGTVDHCDIIELADAIPDGVFDYIWFDCCYMGGIEIAYQFRNKADYMVAYPTEVWGDGMQYSLTMPYVVRKNPDLKSAAKAFADYYIRQNLAVTVGVYDLKAMEKLADIVSQRDDSRLPPRFYFVNYGRRGLGPFYDLGQFVKSEALQFSGKWSRGAYDEAMAAFDDAALNEALSEFVIFKSSYESDFNRQPIPEAYFSGVSIYYIIDEMIESTDYYRQLDWYKRTNLVES